MDLSQQHPFFQRDNYRFHVHVHRECLIKYIRSVLYHQIFIIEKSKSYLWDLVSFKIIIFQGVVHVGVTF